MISNQLFVRIDKPLQEVCQTHYIMCTSLLLIISHLLVVLLHQVLLDHFLDFDDHFLILFAVALVQALQLTIRYKALPVGEEERLKDDVLEEVPWEQYIDEDEAGDYCKVILEVQDQACTTSQGHCQDNCREETRRKSKVNNY